MSKRIIAALVAVGATLFLLAGPAGAQYADPAGLTSSDGSGCSAGGPVTFTVVGAAPGTEVTFVFDDEVVLGVATVDANGEAVLETSWPDDASSGEHTVRAEGQEGEADGPVALDVAIAVDCSVAGGATLARTGSDSLPWVQVGVVLVAIGGLALLAGRRRYAVVRERV